MLLPYCKKNCLEAGIDEAGRGCLAGPVYAAAVVLPSHFNHPLLRDSKKLTHNQRFFIRKEIEKHAIAFSVAYVDERIIDKINILNASIKAMHLAVKALDPEPEHLLVDGNYFKPFGKIPYTTVVKGDNTYTSIAAASILAKTYRDEAMTKLSQLYPQYGWENNKGYGTATHIKAIELHGLSKKHRRSFQLKSLATLK
ncbi:MAG: ribonuclease HII [Flavobacteriales bacterium]|nr:ribonuclease HII [Flavobacteriales bacterium]